jgi:branched-chain amino acid transport system permease protein
VQGQELVVTGVSRSFGGVKALDNVSLTATTGKITAIVGPNGSGKTTLLNLISGLVKADSGSITINGRPLGELPPYRVAQLGVGRTFQTPIVPASMPVIDVVSSARYERPYSNMFSTVLRLPRFRAIRAQDNHLSLVALTLVGAVKHADEAASELALGTRRLVEMARALVSAPAVMLLDEPASGLEAEELSAFADLLRELRLAGATIVLVEHNFPFVLSLADTIYVMDQGKVIRSGPPDLIADDPTVIEVYVGAMPADRQQGLHPRAAL